MDRNLSFITKSQLFIVSQVINLQNFILTAFNKILFRKLLIMPSKILIFKTGNIGDIVCAIPSFIAIRRTYPKAKISLLTSPSKKGFLGAEELLAGVWYLDELKVYYTEDIDSFHKKREFVYDLKKEYHRHDLFIQIPEDLASFNSLLRNMIIAKILGIKSAFGFKVRTMQLFKKTQVNYLFRKTEVENLLDMLRDNGILCQKVEFDFNSSNEQRNKIRNLLEEKWGALNPKSIIAAISPGGKREVNLWPAERFGIIAKHLQDKHGAKIIIIGGNNDIPKAKIIKNNLKEKDFLDMTGKLNILETSIILKYCTFLVSNDTGTVHLASAVDVPVIGIYNIRNIFGSWFPYGSRHKILYHKFIKCDYKKEDCIKKSIEMISVGEVIAACNQLIKEEIEKIKEC